MVNWSYFKPAFAGTPEEDAEAHLPHTNDWMRTHNFNEEDRVERFCLTLLGETRLWYETSTPIANDWPTHQSSFRQQYSKLGNISRAILPPMEKFNFNETVNGIDSYVTRVSQWAAILNYGKPQLLELMKNTLPSRFYPILFPVDNLRDMITTEKRVMIEKKKKTKDRPIICHSIYEDK